LKLFHPPAGDGHHPVGAPGYIDEQPGVGPAQPQQHIPPILGRRDHRVRALVQALKGLLQIGGRQGRAVTAHDHGAVTALHGVGQGMVHALAKVGAFLAAQGDVEVTRTPVEEGVLCPRRAPQLHRAQIGPAGKVHGVSDQRGVQPRRAGGAQGIVQPGHDSARLRRLGENEQAGAGKPHGPLWG